jgi:hypothetical protein
MAKIAVIAGALTGLIGSVVALVAVSVGGADSDVTLGVLIGLAFLLIALGVVIGLMLRAQRGTGR